MTDSLAGVAVVHFGELEPTLGCVKSVFADPSEIGRRVAVVDNSGNFSLDGSFSEVTVVRRPDNPGFGAAANVGLATIDGDRACSCYLVLNNDAVLYPGFLAAAAEALEVGVGAAGGPIHNAFDPSVLWYGGGGVNFLTGTVRQRRSQVAASKRRDVGFLPATAISLFPEAWHEVGGFDPRFFLYNEDVDLCLKFRRAGWRLRFEPKMACGHFIGGATGSHRRSPLYLENLTRTRLLPFRFWPYRMYLAVLHTAYNSLRIFGLGLQYGNRCAPYVTAVARGHAHALTTVIPSRRTVAR